MNEPASWVDGDVNGCADTLINRPPYTPGNKDILVKIRNSKQHLISRNLIRH